MVGSMRPYNGFFAYFTTIVSFFDWCYMLLLLSGMRFPYEKKIKSALSFSR